MRLSTALFALVAVLLAGTAVFLSICGHGVPTSAAPARPAATPIPSTWSVVGTLGPYVQVADGCSYYPLTKCDATVLQVSDSQGGLLSRYVGQTVRITLVTAVCGSGIAGQPLYGPVAIRAEPTGPCDTAGATLCNDIQNKVPPAAIQAAMANPETVSGWGERCNPSVAPGPFNGRRTNLTLQNAGAPYHPTYNPVVYKCGCP
jgi:hypothetical protein